MKNYYLLCLLAMLLNSCDTCKHTPTYGGQGRMIYGHSGEIKQRASKNPYYVKAKKQKSNFRNYYN